ncbi:MULTISPECIES: hypothetical protein [unclassified Pseudomonas]|uniref:hypothetical protein n=1 Tax=unclassified Pseudomonas TaxID=196821 RepID=UPI000BA4396E|nr:hypothetical protein [Pseudomonas sp. Irchel 3H3]
MPSRIRCLLLTTLLCPAASAQVMTVQRCEAANGRITFTSTACKTGERPSLQQVRTYLPGSNTEVYADTAVLPEAEHLQAADRAIKAKKMKSAPSRFDEQRRVRQKAKSQTAKSPR